MGQNFGGNRAASEFRDFFSPEVLNPFFKNQKMSCPPPFQIPKKVLGTLPWHPKRQKSTVPPFSAGKSICPIFSKPRSARPRVLKPCPGTLWILLHPTWDGWICIYYCMGCESIQNVFTSEENITNEGMKRKSECYFLGGWKGIVYTSNPGNKMFITCNNLSLI